MKKKKVCCGAAVLLAMQMFFINIIPCYAVEIGSGAYPAETGTCTGTGTMAQEGSPGGFQTAEEKYVLETDRTQISFGSLEHNSFVQGQDIVITNKGTKDVRLLWHEADYHDCIVVDAPDVDSLRPGESCIFTVEADTSLEPGAYSAFLLFGDMEDIYLTNGVQVNISLDIRKPVPAAPVITSVSISPGTMVAAKNSSCAFTASVSGENDYNREVLWSVSGQRSRDTVIDDRGILTVGADETAASLVVKAVSVQDSSYSATALVALQKSAYFIQVKASPEHGGSVYGSGIVEEGGHTVISAAPNNGFIFDGWIADNNKVSGNSQYVVENIRSDRIYVANFKPISCRINITINNSNAGTVTESRTVGYGESITLEAAAKDGYRFESWMENGVIISTDSSMQIDNITDSRSFTAMFSQSKCKLSLACSPADLGVVWGQGVYDKGSDVRITAQPAQGCRFTGWAENGSIVSTKPEYRVDNLLRDRYLVALFKKEQSRTYTIRALTSSPNGTITPEGESAVPEGSGILYTIAPRSGYFIDDVYVDGKSVGAVSSYRFTDVRSEHTVSVDFKEIPGLHNESGAASGTNKTDGNRTNETGINGSGTDAAGISGKGQEDMEGQLQPVEMGGLTGTLQYLNISVEEAERLIDAGDDMELMTGALETGDLQVTIHNDFADLAQETSYSTFYENSSVTNFDRVMAHVLTKKDKMEMLQGNSPVSVNLYINDADKEVSRTTIKAFAEKIVPAMKIGQYFDMILMTSRNSETQMISELPEKLKVVINVPEILRADNRKFYILRLHTNEDGSLDYAELMDEDDNPDTISFSTDRFSPYAIAYIDWQPKGASDSLEDTGESRRESAVVIAAVMLAAAITLLILFYFVKKKN